MHRSVLVTLAVVSAALAGAPVARAHHPDLDGTPHGDPRAALPDSLITQPVAEAEMLDLTPATPDAAGPSLPETWCGEETTTNNTVNQTVPATQAHFKLIYAHASDQPNRFGDFADRLQATVSLLGRYLATQSGELKAPRWDMGSSCPTNPQEYVDIQVVHLPKTLATYNASAGTRFSTLDADVRAAIGAGAQGAGSGPRNILIYADGFFASANGIAGQGSLYNVSQNVGADQPDWPWHNAGGLTSIIYGPTTPPSNGYAWPGPTLHEMSHNMGAVQNTAPHTSGASHCDDRYDVMCYPDGGSSYNETTPCPRGTGAMDETYDCGGDDYFNPAPGAGNYLATHWNLFNSAHLANCSENYVACGVAAPGSDTMPPTNTTPVAGSAWRKTAYSVTLTGSDSQSAVDAWEWQVDNGPLNTTQLATVTGDGTHTLKTRVRDAAGNWSDWRSETVRIDGTEPTAAHGCPGSWSASTVTCAASGADGGSGSGVAKLEYQVGSGSIVTVNSAAGLVTVTAAGETPVKVRATDVAGNTTSTWSTGTARIDNTAPVASVSCPDAWSAQDVACTVTGFDPPGGSGLKSLKWRVGNGPEQSGPSGSTVTVSAGGETTVTATATDNVDRTGSASDTARVDKTAPTANVSCPDSWSGNPVTCTVTGSDAAGGSGLKKLEWQVGDLPAQTGPSGSTFQVGLDGETTVTATATDMVDRTNSASDSARVDKTAPQASVSCPDSWSAANVTCTITGSDAADGSGLKTLSWQMGGGPVQTGPSGSTVEVSAHGTTTVTATATDNVNRTATANDTARVDKTDPVAQVACPDAWSPQDVVCTITGADAPGGSGLRSLTWQVGGGPVQSGPSGSTVTVAAGGETTVAATATDTADRTGTASDAARVDKANPVPVVSCPAGWSSPTATCTITATDSGGSGLKTLTWRVGGGPLQTGPSGSTAVVFTNGETAVTATAEDNAGRIGGTSAIARVDLTDPNVAVNCPDAWSADPVTCTITASDAHSGLKTLTWRVGNGDVQSGPSGSTVDVGAGGETAVSATAEDNVGSTADASDTARVDTTPPDAGVDCPDAWSAGDVVCTISGSDAGSGLESLTWRVGDGPEQSGPSGSTVTVTTGGETTVTATATDNVDRTATAGDTARSDRAAPEAAVSCPPGWSKGTVTCTITGTDAGSGLKRLEWQVGDGPAQTGPSGSTVDVSAHGPTTIAATATDNVDRTGEATGTARVDKEPPSVAVDCPDAWSAEPVKCSVTAADPHSGLKSLAWQIDGGEPQTGPSGSEVTVSSDGTHTVTATAADQLGQGSQASDTARVDATAPTAAVDCPADWSSDTVTCTITGSDPVGGSGLEKLEWQVGGGPAQSGPSGSTVEVTAAGLTNVSATATDNVGRTGSASGTARVDKVNPTVGVSCPDGWTTAATCTITAGDEHSGIQTLTWKIDGGETQTGEPGSKITVTQQGAHTISASATDRSGRSATASDTASVDAAVPTATLTCEPGWHADGSACRLGVASNPASGVAERRIRVGSSGDGVAWDENGGVPFEGDVQVSARVRNGAGTWSEWTAPVSSKVDRTAPTADISCTATADGRHRCTPSASDAHSGVAEARLLSNGVAWVAVAPGQPFELDGPARLAVTATDAVGRTSTSRTVELAGRTAAPAPQQPPATISRAVATAKVKAGKRTVGKGVLELIGDSDGRRFAARLGVKLGKGTWRLEICVVDRKCVRKTVKLRRARKLALKAGASAPAHEVRAKFKVLRKSGKRFRRYAQGTTSARLGT